MDWFGCKNILCIRADNMGDLLMSAPAIAALKDTLQCRITVLTSSKAAGIAKFIPEISAVIVADLQWVKLGEDPGSEYLQKLIAFLRLQRFDGCVIFNVYSQSALPAAMLAYLAGIPLRLAYCRENPYHLLSNWVPDPEPYTYIVHQVQRDLDLIRMIGINAKENKLRLVTGADSLINATLKAQLQGINLERPYIILHPGVSEAKREYPESLWVSAGKLLTAELGIRLLITGAAQERPLAERIAEGIGDFAFPVAGMFNLEEFIAVIKNAKTLVSVNTATIHLAAASGRPLVVLYAQTNPQHMPWMVRSIVLEYSVAVSSRSKNQVINFVNQQYYPHQVPYPRAEQILQAVKILLEAEK